MSDPSPPTYTPFQTPAGNQDGLNPSFAGESSSPAATSTSPADGEKALGENAPLMPERQQPSDQKSSSPEPRFDNQSSSKIPTVQPPQGYMPPQNSPPQAEIVYAPPPMPPPGFSVSFFVKRIRMHGILTRIVFLNKDNLPDTAAIDATFSANDDSMNPPGYFSVSGVPTRQVLMRAEAQVPISCFAQTERSFQEVKTHDPVIASNPDELFNYFLYYVNEKPSMMVHVNGSHQETRSVIYQVADGKGGFRTERRSETHTVTDFSINLDVSDYIAPTWDRIAATPRKNMKEPQLGEWRAVMEEFTRSKNLLKEIHMEKEILWDYSNIQNSIIAALRMSGYMHTVQVTFPKGNCLVSALSSSALSKAADNTCVKVMCVLTCLCVLFLPIFLLTRKNVNHQLFAYYQCVGTGREFYERNVGVIIGAAMARTCGATYRAF
ncbi:hypothetical protein HDU81_003883 [Chytriomyces hyalinus]|nr:hypothetical protein HDU81_003883 [Chytriomyces hyalinus]